MTLCSDCYKVLHQPQMWHETCIAVECEAYEESRLWPQHDFPRRGDSKVKSLLLFGFYGSVLRQKWVLTSYRSLHLPFYLSGAMSRFWLVETLLEAEYRRWSRTRSRRGPQAEEAPNTPVLTIRDLIVTSGSTANYCFQLWRSFFKDF